MATDIRIPPERSRPAALISDIIAARKAGGLADLCLLFLDVGISYGMGLPLERHPDPAVDAVVQELLHRWHATMQASTGGNVDAQPPEWLREQQALAEAAIGGRR